LDSKRANAEVKALANSLELKQENKRLRDKLSRLKQSDLTEEMDGVYSIDEFKRLESEVHEMREAAQRNKAKLQAHDALLKSSKAMSAEIDRLKDQEVLDNQTIANQVAEIKRIKKGAREKQKEINSLKKMNK